MARSDSIRVYVIQRRMESGLTLWMFGFKAQNRDSGRFVYSNDRRRKEPITIPWTQYDFARIFRKEVLLETTGSRIGDLARLMKSVRGDENQKWMAATILTLARNGLIHQTMWDYWKDKLAQGHRYVGMLVPLGDSSTPNSTTSESSSSEASSREGLPAQGPPPERPPTHPGVCHIQIRSGSSTPKFQLKLSSSVVSPEELAEANLSEQEFFSFRASLEAAGIPLHNIAVSRQVVEEPAAPSPAARSEARPGASSSARSQARPAASSSARPDPRSAQPAELSESEISAIRSRLSSFGIPLGDVEPTKEGVKAIPTFPSAEEIAAALTQTERPSERPSRRPVGRPSGRPMASSPPPPLPSTPRRPEGSTSSSGKSAADQHTTDEIVYSLGNSHQILQRASELGIPSSIPPANTYVQAISLNLSAPQKAKFAKMKAEVEAEEKAKVERTLSSTAAASATGGPSLTQASARSSGAGSSSAHRQSAVPPKAQSSTAGKPAVDPGASHLLGGRLPATSRSSAGISTGLPTRSSVVSSAGITARPPASSSTGPTARSSTGPTQRSSTGLTARSSAVSSAQPSTRSSAVSSAGPSASPPAGSGARSAAGQSAGQSSRSSTPWQSPEGASIFMPIDDMIEIASHSDTRTIADFISASDTVQAVTEVCVMEAKSQAFYRANPTLLPRPLLRPPSPPISFRDPSPFAPRFATAALADESLSPRQPMTGPLAASGASTQSQRKKGGDLDAGR